MDHTQHIQQLITERGYKTYLEIGVQMGHNLFALTGLTRSVGVDPSVVSAPEKNGVEIVGLTSDEYFDRLAHNKKFDLIFIDGLHHADQVESDIVNAHKHLKKGGCIVVHDINPSNEQMTRIPRETKSWCGTVFQAWDGLKAAYPRLITQQFPDDYGIGIIEYSTDIKIEPGFVSNITFDEYKAKYFA